MVLAGGLALAPASAAEGMPTLEECRSGDVNGVSLGRHVGYATVCVGAGGMALLYIGGNPNPLALCGTVAAADQPFPGFDADPTFCDHLGDLPPAFEAAFSVMTPSDYATSDLRYPVLYLLPGGGGDEHEWATLTVPDLQSYADQGVIIVSPRNGLGSYVDWEDGQHPYETLYAGALVDLIDATFRTIPDRTHRAVAGFSQGGGGAALYAALHPDRYVAAGSFSGAVHLTDLYAIALFTIGYGTNSTYAEPLDNNPPWGSFVTDEVWWRGNDPTELAGNLEGVDVWISVGSGIPTLDDVSRGGPLVAMAAQSEATLRIEADAFDRALSAAHVPHTYRVHDGVHDLFYAAADFRDWFPVMLGAFGRSAPTKFDYRTIKPSFSIWGWHFATDPKRAREFLKIANASPSGLTLVGSGGTTVTTPSYFEPGQTVELDGATVPSAVADPDGRITFMVNLGPAHTEQQFTLVQRVLELLGKYFVTKKVSFAQ